MEIPKDDTTRREEQECSPGTDAQTPDDQRRIVHADADERTPEEAGYGYGV